MKRENPHVVIAIPCLKRGGTEMQTLNLIKVLVEDGYRVSTVCYFESDEQVVSEFRETGSKVLLLKFERSKGALQLIIALKQVFKELKPQIIHVQYMAPGALPILAARLAGVKKVLATVHQPYTAGHGLKAKFLLRISAMFCTRFICVSQNAEISWFGSGALYNENLPLTKQAKHFTIYNAVDVNRIQQIKGETNLVESRQQLGITNDCCLIGAVSRLTFEKGIDILINAFALAIQKKSNIHLLIVGAGKEDSQLKALVSKLGIEKYCTFFGEADWTTAMQQMALMDVVVVPSRFEGFGLTAAEAMAMGKPVIASDVFGLKEVITHEKTGLIFEESNINQLSEAIIKIVSDSTIMMSIANYALKVCANKFDLSGFRNQNLSLYLSVYND